jgi:hypothetical protein
MEFLGVEADNRPDIRDGWVSLVRLGVLHLLVDTNTLPAAGGAFPMDILIRELGGALPLVTLLF